MRRSIEEEREEGVRDLSSTLNEKCGGSFRATDRIFVEG